MSFALTPEVLVRSVIDHFPLIESAEQKQKAAENAVISAKGEFDHKLVHKTKLWRQNPYNNEYYETAIKRQTPWGGAELEVGHRQGAGNFNTYQRGLDTSPAGQIFAGITMPILRNLMTDSYRTDLKMRNIDKEIADQELRIKKLTTVHKALGLYYKWLLQQKKVDVAKELLDLAKNRKTMVEKKFKAGDMERLKLTDTERQINQRESGLVEAEIELKRYAMELSLYHRDSSGLPRIPESVTSPEKILESLDDPGTKKTPQNENPQIKTVSLRKELNDVQEDLAEQLRLPGLNVGVMGGRELSPRPGYGQHILEVGVSFDFPLENRKARGKTVEYYYKKKATELEATYVGQELTQLSQFSREAGVKSRARWNIISEEFVNTSKMAEAERRRWKLGSSDLFVVNLREQDQASVDVKRWTALYEYHQYNLDAALYTAGLPID